MDVDKISFDLKRNPEVAASLAGASPGDTVIIKNLEICIDEIAEDMVVGSVCEVGEMTVEEADKEDKASGEPDEEATAPVISVMSQGYEKKTKK